MKILREIVNSIDNEKWRNKIFKNKILNENLDYNPNVKDFSYILPLKKFHLQVSQFFGLLEIFSAYLLFVLH